MGKIEQRLRKFKSPFLSDLYPFCRSHPRDCAQCDFSTLVADMINQDIKLNGLVLTCQGEPMDQTTLCKTETVSLHSGSI